MPIEHRAALAQAIPVLFQPVRSVLHVCGCAPLQRISPMAHAAALHIPPEHSPAVWQAMPLLSQPSWFALQTWG